MYCAPPTQETRSYRSESERTHRSSIFRVLSYMLLRHPAVPNAPLPLAPPPKSPRLAHSTLRPPSRAGRTRQRGTRRSQPFAWLRSRRQTPSCTAPASGSQTVQVSRAAGPAQRPAVARTPRGPTLTPRSRAVARARRRDRLRRRRLLPRRRRALMGRGRPVRRPLVGGRRSAGGRPSP